MPVTVERNPTSSARATRRFAWSEAILVRLGSGGPRGRTLVWARPVGDGGCVALGTATMESCAPYPPREPRTRRRTVVTRSRARSLPSGHAPSGATHISDRPRSILGSNRNPRPSVPKSLPWRYPRHPGESRGLAVRPARVSTRRCKSSRKQAIVNEEKRNCGRATDRGEEAWIETAR